MAKYDYKVQYVKKDGTVVSRECSSEKEANKVYKRWTQLFGKIGKVELIKK